MTIKTRSRLIVFVLSFLVWVALTSIRDLQEVIAGAILAFLVSLFAGHFLVTTEKHQHLTRRIFTGIRYFLKFLWEMVKANIHVAYIVLHPRVPIKPGIVKVKTNLTKDSAITVLANSITLTPGTLTVDINPDTRELYVHWITVDSTDLGTTSESIGGRFEHLLTEVFE